MLQIIQNRTQILYLGTLAGKGDGFEAAGQGPGGPGLMWLHLCPPSWTAELWLW